MICLRPWKEARALRLRLKDLQAQSVYSDERVESLNRIIDQLISGLNDAHAEINRLNKENDALRG